MPSVAELAIGVYRRWGWRAIRSPAHIQKGKLSHPLWILYAASSKVYDVPIRRRVNEFWSRRMLGPEWVQGFYDGFAGRHGPETVCQDEAYHRGYSQGQQALDLLHSEGVLCPDEEAAGWIAFHN